jgi:hypothetical protein
MLVCSFFTALEAAREKHELTDYDRRVIAFYMEHGHYTDHPGYPEEHQYWKDLKWFYAQKEKVRPALMYLLEHEYKGQWEKMSNTMNGLETRPGNKNDLVNYIRRSLPQFVDNREKEAGRYLNKSIRLLSKYGDSSDLPLLEKFLNIEGVIEQFHVKENIQKLKDRLAKEKEISEIRDNRSKRPKPADEINKLDKPSPERASSKSATTTATSQTPLWSKWPIIVVIVLVLSAIFIWLKSKSRA